MNPRKLACSLALGSALVAAAPLIAMQNHTPATGSAKPAVRRGPGAQGQYAEADGERVFQQNCARCHNAPDGFSQRISGTIVQHMRVRANLSQHDQEVLLHYFNP